MISTEGRTGGGAIGTIVAIVTIEGSPATSWGNYQEEAENFKNNMTV